MRFNSFRELADHLRAVQKRLPAMERGMLLMWAEETQHEVKEHILGRITPLNQPPFTEWAPLKDATIERKAREGLGKDGNPESMLYATGNLHDSIDYSIVGNRAEVGTNVEYAGALEYGSSKMPPRPFLGPGGMRAMLKLYPRFENIVHRTIEGKRAF